MCECYFAKPTGPIKLKLGITTKKALKKACLYLEILYAAI